jgi:hypothetical protein
MRDKTTGCLKKNPVEKTDNKPSSIRLFLFPKLLFYLRILNIVKRISSLRYLFLFKNS